MDGKMRKLLFMNTCVLLTLGCATVPVQDKVNIKVDYNAGQRDFRGSSSCGSGQAYADFYLTWGEMQENINTIALLPLGIVDQYKYDSINFHDERWIDFLKESVKAELIKGYKSKYVDSLMIDTTTKWREFVGSYRHAVETDLIWKKIYATIDTAKHKPTWDWIDSLHKLFDAPTLASILPSTVDSHVNNSWLYRDKRINDLYEVWGGKPSYDLLCDSLTKIVYDEFSTKGLFGIIQPTIATVKCDSIYHSLDKYRQNIWYSFFYPDTTGGLYQPYTTAYECDADENTIKQLSFDILQGLGVDAYVVLNVSYDNYTLVRFDDNHKNSRAESTRQVCFKISMISLGFNVLWSADLPISKQIRRKYSMPSKKEQVAINPFEIIDYNMARENVKQVLELLKSNRAWDKFQ